jgi:hypothetical protein
MGYIVHESCRILILKSNNAKNLEMMARNRDHTTTPPGATSL